MKQDIGTKKKHVFLINVPNLFSKYYIRKKTHLNCPRFL